MPIKLIPNKAPVQPAKGQSTVTPITGAHKTTDDGPLDFPVGRFYVVDPTKEIEVVFAGDGSVVSGGDAIIGTIAYPLEFCVVERCDKVPSNAKHPFSFMRRYKPFVWYHRYCGRPTKAWWHEHFTDVVDVAENVKLPWND